jgi:hypothetical protein
MNGKVEAISKNREGATCLKIVISDVAADELRLGDIEVSQRKYNQTTLEM